RMKQEINRLRMLLENILDLSRLDLRGDQVTLAHADLNAVVESVINAHLPRAEAAKLHLIHECDRQLPPVCAEYNQLSQVVTNLVANAINYTPGGEVRVQTCFDRERHRGCLIIRDTGIGITEADL